MMKFTNHEDLIRTVEEMELTGWYVVSDDGDYLGRITQDEEEGLWYVGMGTVDEILFPVTLEMTPR